MHTPLKSTNIRDNRQQLELDASRIQRILCCACILTKYSHKFAWNRVFKISSKNLWHPPKKTIWRFFAKFVSPRKQSYNLTVFLSTNVHFERSCKNAKFFPAKTIWTFKLTNFHWNVHFVSPNLFSFNVVTFFFVFLPPKLVKIFAPPVIFAQPWHLSYFAPTHHQSCLSVFLHPLPTLQNNEPVPQVLKQVVNLSC